MEKKYIAAIDQGTTSTRFVLFDREGKIVCSSQKEHKQIYPSPGWVEHDALEIWENTCEVIKAVFEKSGVNSEEIASIGITNQRETTLLWDKKTGKPFYNAIVWQDTRTLEICKELDRKDEEDKFKNKTGLPLATYFSGPKIMWIMNNISEVKKAVKEGRALFGTMDAWLIWKLTGQHITDVTNASRTLLFNIGKCSWDNDILEIMNIPEIILPEVRSSSDSEVYGYTKASGPFGREIPVTGCLGDQQAALFGQVCYSPGEAKNTYGTGCFLLLNTGEKPVHSRHGLLTTLAYRIGKNKPVYALEGSIAIAGSLIQWARDKLGIIATSPEINELAKSVEDNGGVYYVQAFSGLFAPRWRPDARGLIIGLTHYASKGHIARAILEATAYQTREVFEAMAKDSGISLKKLKVDGGMTASEILMQFQSDILNVPVLRPSITETTVLGAAYAAGLAVGFWKDMEELRRNWKIDKEWLPAMEENRRERLYHFWLKAVGRTYNWIE